MPEQPAGRSKIRVSLQIREELPALSRTERRQLLSGRFEQLAGEISAMGVEIDLDSLSISSQTIEANLDVEHYENLVRELTTRGIRIDEILVRQVVPPY